MDIGQLIAFAVPVALLVLAWVTGTTVERRHFRSIAARERAASDVLVTDLRDFPQAGPGDPGLVVAEVVLATDYLKSFLASLKKIVGGELRSYESVVERARREAVLRLVEEARRLGFDAVSNLRFATADIGGNAKRQGAAIVAVIASGTAYRRDRSAA